LDFADGVFNLTRDLAIVGALTVLTDSMQTDSGSYISRVLTDVKRSSVKKGIGQIGQIGQRPASRNDRRAAEILLLKGENAWRAVLGSASDRARSSARLRASHEEATPPARAFVIFCAARERLYPAIRLQRQRTVIIAVIAVLVVQASVDQIIGMVAVRDHLMTAILVAASAPGRRALDRVGGAHGDYTLVVVVAVGTMQVAVVQIIDVAFMLKAEVPAMFAVGVSMSGVCSMRLCSLRHCRLSFL
jgi:hypothetical protein